MEGERRRNWWLLFAVEAAARGGLKAGESYGEQGRLGEERDEGFRFLIGFGI